MKDSMEWWIYSRWQPLRYAAPERKSKMITATGATSDMDRSFISKTNLPCQCAIKNRLTRPEANFRATIGVESNNPFYKFYQHL